MKLLTTILLICFSFNLGQAQSGTVTYKKAMVFPEDMYGSLKETDPKTYRNFMAHNKKMQEAAKQLEFKLRFAKAEAIFEPQEIMSTASIDAHLGLGPSDGVHYTNRSTAENLWQTDAFFGMTLLISMEEPEWELQNETKIVSGYRVKKAIGETTMRKGAEERVHTIEAWYAPDIPLSFGPLGFAGLPGLIIELKLGHECYYLSEITIKSEEEIMVERPSKGRKITFEELQEMASQAMGNMKRN